MNKLYVIEDVRHLIPEVLTPSQEAGILDYLNKGKIPPADPCLSCEPNLIRKFIARLQAEERAGRWTKPTHVVLRNEFVPAVEAAKETEEKAEEKPKPKPRTRGK